MSKTYAAVMAEAVEKLGLGPDCRTWKDIDKVADAMVSALKAVAVEATPGIWEWDEQANKSVGYDWQFRSALGNTQASPLASQEDAIWLRRCQIETTVGDPS